MAGWKRHRGCNPCSERRRKQQDQKAEGENGPGKGRRPFLSEVRKSCDRIDVVICMLTWSHSETASVSLLCLMSRESPGETCRCGEGTKGPRLQRRASCGWSTDTHDSILESVFRVLESLGNGPAPWWQSGSDHWPLDSVRDLELCEAASRGRFARLARSISAVSVCTRTSNRAKRNSFKTVTSA